MFTFAIILALASTCFELMLAAKIKLMRVMSHKSLTFNLANSMVISWITGMMFGAAGLIAMTAGILSTLMSIPGYHFLYWMYDSPEAQSRGGNQLQYYRDKWNARKVEVKQTIADFFNLIYKIIRILTFPFWGMRIAIRKYNQIKTRLAS